MAGGYRARERGGGQEERPFWGEGDCGSWRGRASREAGTCREGVWARREQRSGQVGWGWEGLMTAVEHAGKTGGGGRPGDEDWGWERQVQWACPGGEGREEERGVEGETEPGQDATGALRPSLWERGGKGRDKWEEEEAQSGDEGVGERRASEGHAQGSRPPEPLEGS